MNYFFVFQNKTFHEEHQGGYLWAPQYGNSGRTASHWSKMKEVKRGDVIIHSYKKQIIAISVAKKDVYVAKKPVELSNDWQTDGWRVDTQYIVFPNPIITSNYMEELLELQPQTSAPFNRLGRGNTGYLFEATREMYEFIIAQTATYPQNENALKQALELVNQIEHPQNKVSEVEVVMELEAFKANILSVDKLAILLKETKPHKSQKTEVEVLYRSPYLKKMVKRMANGICQMCGEKAPFYDRNNEPYLEEHHVKQLAKGGSDTMDNVVAICPNCHRRVHVLKKDEDVIILEKMAKQNNNRYQRLLAYIEKMQNEQSINSLEEDMLQLMELQNEDSPNTNRSN